jgi:hypothetical protein
MRSLLKLPVPNFALAGTRVRTETNYSRCLAHRTIMAQLRKSRFANSLPSG